MEAEALKNVFKECSVPASFIEWLEKEGVKTIEDFAVLATSEEKVEVNIIDVANAAGVNGLEVKSMAAKVAVKKSWLRARTALTKDTAIQSGSVAEPSPDNPLDPKVASSLETLWMNKHGFALQIHRLLVSPLLRRLHAEVHASPPKLTVLLLEQIRTQAAPGKKAGVGVVLTPGEEAKAESVYAEEVGAHIQIYTRARAYFSSLAYVAVDCPDWFSFGDCENICDLILDFIHRRYRDKRPPVSFFYEAFLSTMQIFVAAVCTDKRTLSNIVRSRSEWTTAWTNFSAVVDPSGNSAAISGQPEISKALRKEVNDAQALARTLQSENDRARHQKGFGRSSNGNQNDKGGGKGNWKNGKGGNQKRSFNLISREDRGDRGGRGDRDGRRNGGGQSRR